MGIRNSEPMAFVPVGISDALDQSSSFQGACIALQNLTFDRINRGAVVPRPGVSAESTFPGFVMPGVISVMFSVGQYIYGMINSNRFGAMLDEPFCYDTLNMVLIPVSGVNINNVPTTQPSSGAWVPPTMDTLGIYVIVTHPGFNSSNYFGYFNITNPSDPVWSAGNTGTNPLPSVPQWVAQFYGRAFFGIGNAVYFTDQLALTISNTNFAGVLTIDDKSSTTGAAGLPLSNTTGGILQALIVFKQNSIWEIYGDIASTTNPLSLNKLSDGIGCVSPRTIKSTPIGVVFIANDGPRIVQLNSIVSYLKEPDQPTQDIVAPFANATIQSRMCAAYSNSVYRVGFDTNMSLWDNTYTSVDYWFDLIFQRWNGPHTFPYHCATQVNGVFYLGSNNYPGVLFNSQQSLTPTSTYQDYGIQYTCNMVSSFMSGQLNKMSAVIETTVELCGSATEVSYYMSIYDDQNNPLAPATISLNSADPIWGTSKWAQFKWRSSIPTSTNYSIPWTNPIVAKKFLMSINCVAAQNVSIKEIVFNVQILNYKNNK